MTTNTKDVLRQLARRVANDPTANAEMKQLAKGVLMLMGEKLK